MKRTLSIMVISMVVIFGMGSVNAEDKAPDKTVKQAANADDAITQLIKKLAELTNQGEKCGEQLNNNGKKALKGKECTQFTSGFNAAWQDREDLNNEMDTYIENAEQGKMSCDDVCQSKLQRAGELRITVQYYLDYIEYMRDF